MESVLIEIRAAEGGEDAKLLVREQFIIYGKVAARQSFELEVVEERPGIMVFRASGRGVAKAFANESGGHRHQRIPPTEKRGRVQTSTVTVAVLEVPKESEVRIDERDIEWTTCRSSGPGGQNVNKTESAVQVTHKPTGLQVRCESERSQLMNKATALATLRAKLQATATSTANRDRNDTRKRLIGCGERSDKTRTYRWQDNIVSDHQTGKKSTMDKVRRGCLEDLW